MDLLPLGYTTLLTCIGCLLALKSRPGAHTPVEQHPGICPTTQGAVYPPTRCWEPLEDFLCLSFPLCKQDCDILHTQASWESNYELSLL